MEYLWLATPLCVALLFCRGFAIRKVRMGTRSRYLDDLPDGETILITGFDGEKRPIVEFVNNPNGYRFALLRVELLGLRIGWKYRVDEGYNSLNSKSLLQTTKNQ
jgi:hypothetical protein